MSDYELVSPLLVNNYNIPDIYNKLLNKHYLKTLLKLKENKQFILLAIFPITLYNYIIKLIKKIVVMKGKINEKNNSNINDVINDNNTSRM